MVLVFAPKSDGDELQMQEEMFKHYGNAPVVGVISRADNEVIKELFGKKAESMDSQDDVSANKELYAVMMTMLKANYEKLLESDVVPAFSKFDTDGSGAIDKSELKNLMKMLDHHDLTDEQCQEAFKDLDLNGDGVIDLEEFKRWYFTGMKSYTGTRRFMLKVKDGSKKLLDAIADEAKMALLEQELKYKKSKVTYSFNAPADPKTKYAARINVGGADNQKVADALYGRYGGTLDHQKMKAIADS